MKEQVIMPHWMMFSMFVAKFQLHEPPGMWELYANGLGFMREQNKRIILYQVIAV